MEKKRILVGVAGASGGHIIPGIMFLQQEAQKEAAEVLFFSTKTEFDQSILKHYTTSFTYRSLPLIPVPGKKFWRYPLFLYKTLHTFFLSLISLRRVRPTRVISMGGYISVPVCLAAWLLGIEVQLFELNAVPGKAVRWLAPLATTIFVCFEDAVSYFDRSKVQNISYPLRFTEADSMSQKQARELLGLSLHKEVLLVIGGSQGSQGLNSLMKKVSAYLTDTNRAIIHQTGGSRQDVQDHWRTFYQEHGIEALVFAYSHELNICYEAADLVISRAGAGSIFELVFFKKKSVLIPLELAAEAHQLENAEAIIKKYPQLFLLMRQQEAEQNPSFLIQALKKLSDSKL